MASVRNNVLLHIAERQGNAFVEVSYAIDATHHDVQGRKSYRVLVELVGVDQGPGEDGRNELIPNGKISDEVITFNPQSEFVRTVAANIPSVILDEDPGFVPQQDEIQARVSLIPVTLTPPSVFSNIVRRGAPVGSKA